MTDAEHYELQEFYEYAHEAFIVDRLPQSEVARKNRPGVCSYTYPPIINHGCAIGCRDGFDDLPNGTVHASRTSRELCRKLGFSEITADDHHQFFQALRELQRLHDRGRIAKGPLWKRREYLRQFADKWGLEEVTG